MPFGQNCQFKTFDACVKAMIKAGKKKETAKKICGALQRDTEEKCKGKGSLSFKDQVAAEMTIKQIEREENS